MAIMLKIRFAAFDGYILNRAYPAAGSAAVASVICLEFLVPGAGILQHFFGRKELWQLVKEITAFLNLPFSGSNIFCHTPAFMIQQT